MSAITPPRRRGAKKMEDDDIASDHRRINTRLEGTHARTSSGPQEAYLDDAVLVTVGIESVLNVTLSHDAQVTLR